MDLGATKTFIMFGALYLWWDAYLVHIWSIVILVRCIYGAYLVGCMSDAMHLWCGDDLVAHCIFGMVILWCIFSALYLWWDTSLVWWVFGMVGCIFGKLHLWCDAFMLRCIFGGMYLWWAAYMIWCIFGVLHLQCVAFLVLFICTFGMLCIGIFVGAIKIVQCIFGALFLGWNVFLVLRLWCYALSATLRLKVISLIILHRWGGARVFGIFVVFRVWWVALQAAQSMSMRSLIMSWCLVQDWIALAGTSQEDYLKAIHKYLFNQSNITEAFKKNW